jgi:hypothetical protein
MKKTISQMGWMSGLAVMILGIGAHTAFGFGKWKETDTLAVIQPGEVLQYSVSWNFLRLGTIAVVTKHDSSAEDPNRCLLVMHVLSNPDLPFVDIREFNESKVDVRSLMSDAFRGTHCGGEDCLEVRYEYQRESRKVDVAQWLQTGEKPLVPDTSFSCPPFVDGPSLFFFARAHSLDRGNLDVPTLVNGVMASTRLEFDGTGEPVELECLDYPVASRKISGFADWRGGGAAGMTGRFTGWLSDDAEAVPLVAEMEILLGSIRIELEAWQRTGWTPPSADDDYTQLSRN